jgi:small conductance mechanosensitive channel
MMQELANLWESHQGKILEIARNAAASALIIVLGAAISKGFGRLLARASTGKLHADGAAISLLQRVVRYAIFIVCVIMILNIFGVNTASLVAVLGAAGVAVGLALKDALGNMAAGIILIFLGCYRKGEFIECGSFSGTVQDISLFTTILETPDGVYVSAPNSCVWGGPLKNYTRNGKRRMELTARLSSSDSLDTAFQVMRGIATTEAGFLSDPEPQLVFQPLDDGHNSIILRAWASGPDYWDIYWRQTRNIKEKLEEAGLHIPYPRQDVRLVKE